MFVSLDGVLVRPALGRGKWDIVTQSDLEEVKEAHPEFVASCGGDSLVGSMPWLGEHCGIYDGQELLESWRWLNPKEVDYAPRRALVLAVLAVSNEEYHDEPPPKSLAAALTELAGQEPAA